LLPTTPTGLVRSWDAIEEKYGRVIAYQVKQIAPFTEPNYGNMVGNLDSTADFYLNPRTEAKLYPKVDEEQFIEIGECNGDDHFLHLEPIVKKDYLENGRRKCLNLKESYVSGGTLEEKEEHLIIVRW